jgi:hypothetical protein
MLTRDQVLAATSAAELFGHQALESRRALRKAYAELTKAFPPERDPECFRRIRDAYEALGSHFELAEISTPNPIPEPDDRKQEPRAHREASLPDRREVAHAVLEECANLINQGNARAALAHLDAHEAEVRPVVPTHWTRMMIFLLAQLAWEIDKARAERAFDDLDDPSIEIGEQDYWLLYERLIMGQAWQAARLDDELPVEILDAIRRSGALDRLELATLWLDTLSKLGTGGFLKAYDAISSRHPGLLAELYRIEDAITFVARFNSGWEFDETRLRLPEKFTAELAALRQLRQQAWAKQEPPPKPDQKAAVRDSSAVIVVAVFLVWILSAVPEIGRKGALAIAAAIVIVYFATRKRAKSEKKSENDARPPAERLRERCLKLVASGGLFRHEVLAAVAGKRVPERASLGQNVFFTELIDPLFDVELRPPTGLALLSRAQLERIQRQKERAKAEQDLP